MTPSSPSLDRSMSSMSISSVDSQPEDDWDRSLVIDTATATTMADVPQAGPSSMAESSSNATSSTSSQPSQGHTRTNTHTTPRNSVIFPAEGDTPGRTRYSSHSASASVDVDALGVGAGAGGLGALLGEGKGMATGGGKRTLSELLRLHSEKGSNGRFSAEEASRIADVLGQWINASSSPYEGEIDDFFLSRSLSQDDIKLTSPSARDSAVGGFSALGRPRGRSESANSTSSLGLGLGVPQGQGCSRPPSALGAAAAV